MSMSMYHSNCISQHIERCELTLVHHRRKGGVEAYDIYGAMLLRGVRHGIK